MKTFIAILGLILVARVSAQVPQGINYQSVLRDGSGNLLDNANVEVRFTIHESTASGNVVYSEEHVLTSNSHGLIMAVIGTGSILSGTFSAIDWIGDDFFLQTECDAGSGFIDLGTAQLQSVPYAQAAGKSVEATEMFLDYLLDVDAPTPSTGQVLKWDGTDWVAADEAWAIGTCTSNDNGLSVFVDSSYVGLGISNPRDRLHIHDGNLRITYGTDSLNGLLIDGSSGGATILSNEEIELRTDNGGYFGFYSDGGLVRMMIENQDQTSIYGYTRLGTTSSPYIATKKLTGTTAATQGVFTTVAHGLDGSKIIGVSMRVDYGNGFIPPSYTGTSGYQYEYYYDAGFFYVFNKAANSAAILSKPITILITYEE